MSLILEKILREKVQSEKSTQNFRPDSQAIITEAGNIVKVTTLTRCNHEQTIQLLPGGDQYVKISTGEVKDIKHTENRAENVQSIRQTFQRLAMLVNANTDKPYKCRFVTLTYAENLRDLKRLYRDFSLFWKRFRYYCLNQDYGKPEYIAIAEPQARGAWHLHVIIIFEKRAPFIENATLADIWGHGFVNVRAIDSVDNVGAYLCAYLTDLEVPEGDSDFEALAAEAFEFIERKVDGKSKRFIKGGRLHLYPTGMRIYRCSKGVKRPVKWKTTMAEAISYTSDMVQTYGKLSSFASEDSSFSTYIYTTYYHKAREGKTANGYFDKTFGPMREVKFEKPKKPKEPYVPPPDMTIEEYEKTTFREITDEDFAALMLPKPEWAGKTPDWAKDSDTSKKD